MNETTAAKSQALDDLLKENREALSVLCARYEVLRLSLFGSVTDDRFDAESDVNVLVDFKPMTPVAHADSYFSLLADLEVLFKRPIDLIESKPITNPYFRESIEQTRVLVYEAPCST
jgi:uncharacterized protein